MTKVVCATAPQPAAANSKPKKLDRSSDRLDAKVSAGTDDSNGNFGAISD